MVDLHKRWPTFSPQLDAFLKVKCGLRSQQTAPHSGAEHMEIRSFQKLLAKKLD